MRYEELLEYKVPLNLPADPTIYDEMGDKDIVHEMSNLAPEQTGVNGIIFISTNFTHHGPRVKFYTKAGGDQPSYSVSISGDPKIMANSLPEKIVNKSAPQVFQWVKQNHVALLDFWNNGTTWTSPKVRLFEDNLIPYRGKKGKK